MSSISDLGNSIGFIYVTKPDGTTFVANINNTPDGERQSKVLGLMASSVATNQSAVGIITVDAIAGNGSVTQILVDGVDQINATINYTGATTPTALAASIATEVNNFTPGAGPNYTAKSIGDICYLFAPASSGSDVNGDVVSVSNTGNLTVTTEDVEGGSNSSSVFDQVNGYRFFLNANPTAAAGDLSGSDEITGFVVSRGQQSSIDTIEATIASGVITVARQSSITNVIVDTQGAAATDDLTDIIPTGFAELDLLIIRGADSGRVTTIKSTGNILLKSSNDFETGDNSYAIALQFKDGTFYETARSSQQIGSIADYRAANIPLVTEGVESLVVDLNGATDVLQSVVNTRTQSITGTGTLLGNYEVQLSNVGAIAGDTFYIGYDGTITLNGFTLKVGNYTLSATQALNGGLGFSCYFTGVSWGVVVLYNFKTGTPPKIETAFINTGAITTEKLATNLKDEVLTIPVSFETGETTGQNKIKMPYAGTIVEIFAISTKAIAATDNATITPKNNGGTTMTNGLITFTASDPINTAYTSTPTANNTFVAGDILTFLGEKATAGGKSLVTLKITRS